MSTRDVAMAGFDAMSDSDENDSGCIARMAAPNSPPSTVPSASNALSSNGAAIEWIGGRAMCSWGTCQSTFDDMAMLISHVENDHVSSGKKVYVCEWKQCSRQGAGFLKRHKILSHFRIHTGEKPYVCTIRDCGKTFTRQDSYAAHMRVHLPFRPYVCTAATDCGKTYYHLRSLRKHQFSVHGIKVTTGDEISGEESRLYEINTGSSSPTSITPSPTHASFLREVALPPTALGLGHTEGPTPLSIRPRLGGIAYPVASLPATGLPRSPSIAGSWEIHLSGSVSNPVSPTAGSFQPPEMVHLPSPPKVDPTRLSADQSRRGSTDSGRLPGLREILQGSDQSFMSEVSMVPHTPTQSDADGLAMFYADTSHPPPSASSGRVWLPSLSALSTARWRQDYTSMNRTGSGSVVIMDPAQAPAAQSIHPHKFKREPPLVNWVLQRQQMPRRHDMIHEASMEDAIMTDAADHGAPSAALRAWADGVDSIFGRRGSA